MLVVVIVDWVICVCRRESFAGARNPVAAAGVLKPPAAVRRSRRLAPATRRLGDFTDPTDMSDDEESATTQTSDEYRTG